MRSTSTRLSTAALIGSSNWTGQSRGAGAFAGAAAAVVAKTAARDRTAAAARRRSWVVIMGSTIPVLRRRVVDHHSYGGVSTGPVSAEDAGVAERVPSRLRVHREP